MTPLDFIAHSLKQAADYNSHDSVRPRAILWTDPERVWEPVMDQVRVRLPHVWTLGAYRPEQRTRQRHAQANQVDELLQGCHARAGSWWSAWAMAATCPAKLRHGPSRGATPRLAAIHAPPPDPGRSWNGHRRGRRAGHGKGAEQPAPQNPDWTARAASA